MARRQGFLDAYRAASAICRDRDNGALLDLFLIEKAAYEIGYEAANRPTWLPIPLHGLARDRCDRLRRLAPREGSA